MRGLRVDFDDRSAVLEDIDLDFDAGGYTLIAGPTGSGKSTLALAVIGALEEATSARLSGHVEVQGREIAAVPVHERSSLVAAVWQRPEVQLFRGSVIDEVRAGLDHRLVPAEQGTERARAVLELVGLGKIEERRDPATLSGGEQQRLALAAALVLDTPVLVLDEATSALDAEAAARFGDALDRARASRELTVIAVDHRPDAHLGRADRLVVLEAGRVALDGAPGELYRARRAELAQLGVRRPRGDAGEDHGAQAHPVAGIDHASKTEAAGAPAAQRRHAPSPALRLEGVGISFKRVAAPKTVAVLEDLELELPLGAVALLTGDNGAGKSTLLRLLAAELKPSAGRIVPSRRTRIRAGIGAVPQRAADLMLTTSVIDEVCSAFAHGAPGRDEETRRRAAALISAAGLGGLERSHPLRLSGGQRQRLAVALAMAGDPRLAILDEPTSAQDRAGAEHVLHLLSSDRDQRVTLIATHEPETFEKIAAHRVLLRGGRIVATTP